MQIRLGQPTCIPNTYPVHAEFSYNCYVYELTKFIKKSKKNYRCFLSYYIYIQNFKIKFIIV
jgi:hypothetical protein